MRRGASDTTSHDSAVVIASQVAFMSTAYADAFLSGDLQSHKAHISAVLDNRRRSLVCCAIGFISLLSLLNLERKRKITNRGTADRSQRLGLAGLSGVSIIMVSAVRESANFPIHAVFSCTAFGSAIWLAWLLAADKAAVRRASVLTVVCALTGGLQFANLAGLVSASPVFFGDREPHRTNSPFSGKAQYPSWLLGLGEAIMVIMFGYTIAVA